MNFLDGNGKAFIGEQAAAVLSGDQEAVPTPVRPERSMEQGFQTDEKW